jgi:dTDP-4-amino-4,6-dideoxygalactose transaminase
MVEIIKYVEGCEKALAGLLGRKHCVLTGNGTSALRIAYSLSDDARPKVLLPALVCLNPMLAVHYAKRIPVFADVLMQNATIDPEAVSNMLEKDPKIGAVLAVHLYGHSADMNKLGDICAKHKVMLIEDLAQALGGEFPDGRLFGSAGECSVVSFGYSKILDAGGGGAFLTDDDSLDHRARDLSDHLGKKPAEYERLNMTYRKLFYAFWECGQADAEFYRLFDSFPSLFEKGLLYGITDNQARAIQDLLSVLNEEVSHRRKIAELYKNKLKTISEIEFFSPEEGWVPWRFTFRINKERREDLLKKIRLADYDISSWYPRITEWTPSGRAQKRETFAVANILEKEVVNLWVTGDYDEKKVLSLVKEIKKNLS